MYDKVNTSLNFAEREQHVLDFWRKNNIFAESIKLRASSPVFTFYEGPPTANGTPHIGHVITRAVKDLFPRYKTMKGYKVIRKAGWDTHGLPVELEVEKALGISGKPDIEKFGIEPFIKECKASVFKYQNLWEEMSERVGYWLDMDKPYITYENDYIESVWWALTEIFNKGLMYKSYRVVPYCPRCGTPLSSHEVAQGYKDITEDTAYVAFSVAGKKDEYLLAWTTTPWTLPSNVGLCVNADEDYSRVSCDGKVYILASALVKDVLGENVKIIETVKGKSLEGLKYDPLFDFAAADTINENYCTVVCDSYVTLSDGTGIVHTAPAFGEDDARVSKAYGLPFIQMVDDSGRFKNEAYLFAGEFVKNADAKIIKELAKRGQLVKKLSYTHNYPFCWRCDTPLLYYARDSWFIKMSSLRDELIESNSAVNWHPEHMKKGRFGNFLESVIDWSISRERYWGTPLPIWECECGNRISIGSIKELTDRNPDIDKNIELHRPYIDEVRLPCYKCKSQMTRTPEVIDCWFDSGAMPFAQWHYPFENKELFEEQFPADFISEAVDQTRGWFYSLIAISTMLFGKSPYKNVIVLGHGLDEDGQKMSKSKGNAVSPIDALTKHGADAVRWFLFASSNPWNNFRYSDDAVTEGMRRFMGTLWNTYAFYVLYAEIDNFNPYQYGDGKRSIMDKWLISRLNTLVKKVDTHMENYELYEAARALDSFTDDLSNWYLRLGRKRYWGNEMTEDKVSSYKTLHYALVTLSKLAAPFIPFVTEQIYQNLVQNLNPESPKSIHLCNYPEANNAQIDTELEKQMRDAINIVSVGRAARNAAGTKNRQPLAKMIVSLGGNINLDAELISIILEELNIKSIEFTSSASEFTSYKFKPQLRTLGPKYGKLVPKITEALNIAPNATMDCLNTGTFVKEVDGVTVELTIDDVLIETTQREGFFAATDRGVTVVLDVNLTPGLIEEGSVRELISKLQNMRRDAGFEVTDRIYAGHDKNELLSKVISKNSVFIADEILADKLEKSSPPNGAYVKEWSINGEKIELWVIRK